MATMTATITAPPGPRGIPILGSLRDYQRQGAIEFYAGLWKQYGDIVSMNLGPLPAYIFVRPEHIHYFLVQNPEKYIKGMSHDKLRVAIGNGILTLEGASWYRQRKLMQPNFTPKNIRRFADIMLNAARETLDLW